MLGTLALVFRGHRVTSWLSVKNSVRGFKSHSGRLSYIRRDCRSISQIAQFGRAAGREIRLPEVGEDSHPIQSQVIEDVQGVTPMFDHDHRRAV